MSKTKNDVISIIQNALGKSAGKLNESSTMDDVNSWDSLGHLGVLAALDREFDGQVASIQEMATAGSVKDILDILKKNSLI